MNTYEHREQDERCEHLWTREHLERFRTYEHVNNEQQKGVGLGPRRMTLCLENEKF